MRACIATLLLALLMLSSEQARGDRLVWSTSCDETQVRNGPEPDGSTQSPATGHAIIQYDTVLNELWYDVEWAELAGGLTKLHVHGPADETSSNPQHLIEIFGPPDIPPTVGRQTGAWQDSLELVTLVQPNFDPLTPEQIVSVMSDGLAYVNVHTNVFGMGEIRGNLGLPVVTCRCDVDGNAGLTVQDLLLFVEWWLADSRRAEFDGGAGRTASDLLQFLECWFDATGCA